MHEPRVFSDVFARAKTYPQYLTTAKPNELANWQNFEARVRLSADQQQMLKGISRRINILVISGTWCGDCVQQVPILAQAERVSPANLASGNASPGIALRLIDRDVEAAFAAPFKICGGQRVPAAIFLNEDFEFVSLIGDKTLSRFRLLAQRTLGAACAVPGAAVPEDEISQCASDWLSEIERVALLLRLSAKLRQRHND